MTRIETALSRIVTESKGWPPASADKVAGDMAATPTGQALSALVEAAERVGGRHTSTVAPVDQMELDVAWSDFRAATEPQTAGGDQ